jgi:hypothetical protein
MAMLMAGSESNRHAASPGMEAKPGQMGSWPVPPDSGKGSAGNAQMECTASAGLAVQPDAAAGKLRQPFGQG